MLTFFKCFALAVFFFEAADTARTLRRDIPMTLDQTRSDLNAKVDAALGIVKDTAAAAQTEIQQTRADALNEIDKQASILNGNVATVGASAVGAIDNHLSNLENHATPVLDAAHATLTDTDQTVKDIRPQMIGLVAGWKVVGGETAQTMRTIRDATPQLVDQAKAIGAQGQAIAHDSHKIADDASRYVAAFAKPMSKKQEAFKILILVGIGAIHLI